MSHTCRTNISPRQQARSYGPLSFRSRVASWKPWTQALWTPQCASILLGPHSSPRCFAFQVIFNIAVLIIGSTIALGSLGPDKDAFDDVDLLIKCAGQEGIDGTDSLSLTPGAQSAL